MNRLSYQHKEQNYPGYLLEHAPERVLQFGKEIFRVFVDHFIDILNEKAGFDAKVVVCQPSSPNLQPLTGSTHRRLYTLLLRGCQDGWWHKRQQLPQQYSHNLQTIHIRIRNHMN